jgi:hypothetical protein
MFATLALRSIKCVNRNLLGNLEFQIATYYPNSGRLRATAGDRGRLRETIFIGLVQLDTDRLLRALVQTKGFASGIVNRNLN